MLHHAASNVAIAAVSVLLHAGGDETAVGSCGRTATECVARAPEGKDPETHLAFTAGNDPEMLAAVHRMLGRSPAYRARSWGWVAWRGASASAADPAGDGGVGGAVGAAAGAAAATDTAPSPSSSATAAVGARIFRPESTKFYVRLISRCGGARGCNTSCFGFYLAAAGIPGGVAVGPVDLWLPGHLIT